VNRPAPPVRSAIDGNAKESWCPALALSPDIQDPCGSIETPSEGIASFDVSKDTPIDMLGVE
jgi:hypothetical protein